MQIHTSFELYLLQYGINVEFPRLQVLFDALGDALVVRSYDLAAIFPVHLKFMTSS